MLRKKREKATAGSCCSADRSRVPGFWGYRVPRFRVPGFQVSGVIGFQGSASQISRSPRVPGFQGSQIPEIQGSRRPRVPGLKAYRVPASKGSRVQGGTGPRVPGL